MASRYVEILMTAPHAWMRLHLRPDPAARNDAYYLEQLRTGRPVTPPTVRLRCGLNGNYEVGGNHRIGAALELGLPLTIRFLVMSGIAAKWRAARVAEGFTTVEPSKERANGA